MCIVVDWNDMKTATKDIVVYKVVRVKKGKFLSEFPPTARTSPPTKYLKITQDLFGYDVREIPRTHFISSIIKRLRAGREVEYKLGKRRQSSFKTTPGLMAYVKEQKTSGSQLECIIPAGSKYYFGYELESIKQIITANTLIPIAVVKGAL